jgi:hypothetical protein
MQINQVIKNETESQVMSKDDSQIIDMILTTLMKCVVAAECMDNKIDVSSIELAYRDIKRFEK